MIIFDEKPILVAMHSPHRNYSRFEKFITGNDHPCTMAQTVFKQDQVDLHNYEGFGSRRAAGHILEDLRTYVDNYDFDPNGFQTFIAVFEKEGPQQEQAFEAKLWGQLEFLHEADDRQWDGSVSSDPKDGRFSFSVAGRAFYIVGLHPNSSRKARQAPFTALVFNLHWQFEKLREMGAFQRVRDTIRRRDAKLQGGINPMLEDYGSNSEARQYSGRKVQTDWQCPFRPRENP